MRVCGQRQKKRRQEACSENTLAMASTVENGMSMVWVRHGRVVLCKEEQARPSGGGMFVIMNGEVNVGSCPGGATHMGCRWQVGTPGW